MSALHHALVSVLSLAACGSDDEPDRVASDAGGAVVSGQPEAGLSPNAGAFADAGLPAALGGGAPSPGGTAGAGTGPGAGVVTPGGGGALSGAGGMLGAGGATAGATGGGATAGAGGTAAGGGVPAPTFVDGPVDGDPSKPVVSIPSVACGGPQGLSIPGVPVPATPNLKVGGRDVILSYPCHKREGAAVTFILNLHGTMPTEDLKFYQHSYFAAHALTTSHNLIVATPKSVVSQGGNGDNGQDKPHLYEVIDWVYTNFSKFKITGLWVAGHSWGAMFAKTFVCDEKLKERARGVIGMSGGATPVGGGGFGGLGGSAGAGSAGCTDRISQVHTVGADETSGGVPGLPDQTAAASKHGCKAKVGPMDIGNMQMLDDWPNCSPGWAHFDFTMGAHQHTTPIHPEVVKYIVERIKGTEKKP